MHDGEDEAPTTGTPDDAVPARAPAPENTTSHSQHCHLRGRGRRLPATVAPALCTGAVSPRGEGAAGAGRAR